MISLHASDISNAVRASDIRSVFYFSDRSRKKVNNRICNHYNIIERTAKKTLLRFKI